MKKIISALLLTAIIVLTLSSCECEHEWKDATCTEPKTCVKCGETEGAALGHRWIEATCVSPKKCSVCGETEGGTDSNKHSTKQGKCEYCGVFVDQLASDVERIDELVVDLWTAGSLINMRIGSYVTGPTYKSAKEVYDNALIPDLKEIEKILAKNPNDLNDFRKLFKSLKTKVDSIKVTDSVLDYNKLIEVADACMDARIELRPSILSYKKP